ncbi:MAG: hypothetical protein OXD31_11080 [Chloroflexi bacterium]|nr:hypothetical protein [Chloroflexota bacterium]
MSTEPWEWPGARWWKIDFHAHSPASYDFEDTDDNKGEHWRQWLESARDAGIHAIAITDHNTSQGVEPIQQAVSEVDNPPIVFPAVELTAVDGCHLLLITDPSNNRENIEDLLTRTGVGVAERGKQEGRSELGVEGILDECDEYAIVIGAHANGPDGLLEHDGLQRLAELRDHKLAAVEIDPDILVDETWLNGSKPQIGRVVSQVWSSDAHELAQLGRRFTWVKMTRPNLEGLRLALSDGSASIEPSTSSDTCDPNSDQGDLIIESIEVKGSKLIGRPEPTLVNFNPWMNAIIGGRGTGKSSLVDFCRIALRREGELDGTDSTDEGSLRNLFDRRMRVPDSRGDDGLLTEDTVIKLIYRKDGERFVVAWSQDGSMPPISRIVGDQATEEDGDVRERFPVRIYSQKQLFSLAQDPDALLSVIDDESSVRGRELGRQMLQIEATYLAQCADARATLAQASELPARRASLSDVNRKLELFQQSGHAELLNRFRTRRDTDESWKLILGSGKSQIEAVEKEAMDLSVSDLDADTEIQDGEDVAALRRAHSSLRATIQSLRGDVLARVAQARLEMDAILSGTDAGEWQESVQSAQNEYSLAASRLEEEGLADPNEYSELLDQASRFRTEVQTLESLIEEASVKESAAEDTLQEYREIRNELSSRRKKFADNTSTASLRVEVVPYGNHSGLAEQLIELLGVERFEDDRRAIAERVNAAGGEWNWAALDDTVSRLRRFRVGEIESLDSIDRRFDTALMRAPLEGIDRLALYLPGDSVRVSFTENRPGSSWRSLSQGSPGQQTAALLAFVLGFGKEPIILDQPEDDLDNTLIYQLLVTRLREEKVNRQVIVITHNPNIVVHGDAELVVSLNISQSQTVIERQGGLQERDVRDEICTVMEGGKEAFETRYRRIMPSSGP